MKKYNLGFTLIEMLVVIAIIAILAAIVLASLAASRKSAVDTTIKTYTENVQGTLALYLQNHGDYGHTYFGDLCPTASDPSVFYSDPDTRNYIALLNAKNGNKTICASGTTDPDSTNASTYAIASPVSYSSQYWCLDSAGHIKLSDSGDGSLIARMLAYITPYAYALVPIGGPDLGGGNGEDAVCP